MNGIEIKLGEIYRNRTLRYLVPMLKDWGEEFKSNFLSVWILATGTKDLLHQNEEDYIYCLIDINGFQKYGKYLNKKEGIANFYKKMKYFREHESYVTDYAFDEHKYGHQHMLVLDVPDYYKNSNVFTKFYKGKYSKMYTQPQIKRIINKNATVNNVEMVTDVYRILNKDETYKPTLINTINLEYNTKIVESDIEVPKEYDVPPNLAKEIFNYGKKV